MHQIMGLCLRMSYAGLISKRGMMILTCPRRGLCEQGPYSTRALTTSTAACHCLVNGFQGASDEQAVSV